MFLNLEKEYGKIVEILDADEIIAYPTEAVFGIGGLATSEKALLKMNALKGRQIDQRSLVVAANWEQVESWIHCPTYAMSRVASRRKRATTYLFSASSQAPEHLVSQGRIAIRLTQMRSLKALCLHAPLLSSSANLTGFSAAKTSQEVRDYFPDIPIVTGEIGGEDNPSMIIDWMSGKIIRS